jgi:hypothetical protein
MKSVADFVLFSMGTATEAKAHVLVIFGGDLEGRCECVGGANIEEAHKRGRGRAGDINKDRRPSSPSDRKLVRRLGRNTVA